MAKLALVYGLRLLPADELESFEDAAVRLQKRQGRLGDHARY